MTKLTQENINKYPELVAFLDADETISQNLGMHLKERYILGKRTYTAIEITAFFGKLAHLDTLLLTQSSLVNANENYALKMAAKSGRLEVVNRLLEFKEVRDYIDAKYNAALQGAANHGCLEVVNRLLEFKKVKLNIDADNNGALSSAALNGHLDVVNRLLKFKKVRDNLGEDGNLALKCAANNGHLNVVNRLLEFKRVKLNIDTDDNAALSLAALNGHLDVVNRFLKFKKVRDILGEGDNTALRCAVKGGHLGIVNRLLEFDKVADNIDAGFDFNSLLTVAAKNGHLNIVNRLLKFKKIIDKIGYASGIQEAASNGHLDVVNRLIDYDKEIDNSDVEYSFSQRIVQLFSNSNIIKDNIDKSDNVIIRFAAANGHLDIVNRLLEFKKVTDMIDANRNEALRNAAANGHLDIVNRLLEFKKVTDMIDADDNDALRAAAADGHLDVVNRLLEFKKVTDKIDANDNDALQHAAKKGHLGVVNRLLEFQKVANNIDADNNEAFRNAAANGHLDIVNRLLEFKKVTDNINIIGARGNNALSSAAEKGHLVVVNRLLKFKKVRDNLGESGYLALLRAAANGHLTVVNRLLEFKKVINKSENIGELIENSAKNGHLAVVNRLFEEDTKSEIAADFGRRFHFSTGLRLAALNGHLAVVNRLLQTPEITSLIDGLDNAALRGAAREGHLTIVNRLLEFKEVVDNIDVNDNEALGNAAYNGHLDVVNRLLKFQKVTDKIDANGNQALLSAAENGHLGVVIRLLTFKKVTDKIAADNNKALKNATRSRNWRIVKRLIPFPKVFAYAEIHEHEYSRYTHPFIADKLHALRTQKIALETTLPTTVFDVNEEEANLCFYILRNFIRRNDGTLLDDFNFLLDIPAVKALVHTAVTPNQPNELVRLAISIGNQGVTERLINIPAVRELAQQNDFYLREAQGQLDLRALAQDSESSMHALSAGETKRLKAALTHYQPKIAVAGGVEKVFKSLCDALIRRYEQNPAKIKVNGKLVNLPVSWKAFNDLNLKDHARKVALMAYHKHKVHTALRYLSKPNYWMSPNADYVECNRSNPHERWSTFYHFKEIIVLFWSAAKDSEIPPTDDYTFEGRLSHFFDELAHLGRAHSWDNKRVIGTDEDGADITEEYDNYIDGDQPSCYSGVNRRLFQSVVGHPLLNLLTLDKIKQECRHFVRAYFNSFLTQENRQTFLEAWNNYTVNLEPDDFLTLKKLDIPDEKQHLFITQLAKKYGEQFNDDPAFMTYIRKRFQLGKNDAHAIQFAGETQLEQLLASPIVEKTPPTISIRARIKRVYYAVSEKKISTRTASTEAPVQELLATLKTSATYTIYTTATAANVEKTKKSEQGRFWGITKPAVFVIKTCENTALKNEAQIQEQQIETALYIQEGTSNQKILLRSRVHENELRDIVLKAYDNYDTVSKSTTSTSSSIMESVCSTSSTSATETTTSHGSSGLARALAFKEALEGLEYVELIEKMQEYANGRFNGNFEIGRSFKAILYEELVKKYGTSEQKDELSVLVSMGKEELLEAITAADEHIKDGVFATLIKPSANLGKTCLK